MEGFTLIGQCTTEPSVARLSVLACFATQGLVRRFVSHTLLFIPSMHLLSVVLESLAEN